MDNVALGRTYFVFLQGSLENSILIGHSRHSDISVSYLTYVLSLRSLQED